MVRKASTSACEYHNTLQYFVTVLTCIRDTIDTERFDGNVWKMLLGAIDAMFDNDDE